MREALIRGRRSFYLMNSKGGANLRRALFLAGALFQINTIRSYEMNGGLNKGYKEKASEASFKIENSTSSHSIISVYTVKSYRQNRLIISYQRERRKEALGTRWGRKLSKIWSVSGTQTKGRFPLEQQTIWYLPG